MQDDSGKTTNTNVSSTQHDARCVITIGRTLYQQLLLHGVHCLILLNDTSDRGISSHNSRLQKKRAHKSKTVNVDLRFPSITISIDSTLYYSRLLCVFQLVSLPDGRSDRGIPSQVGVPQQLGQFDSITMRFEQPFPNSIITVAKLR